MNIPLVDLKAQYRAIKPEIDAAIQEVMENTSFIKGPYLKAFEGHFAEACESKFCVGMSSGTTAIEMALRVIPVGSGDEVILPANTFMATMEAVVAVGATPVLVDCDERTSCIDVNQIESKINAGTKAILPVHLYGRPAEMDRILAIARVHNVKVVEDCAQAHLAEFEGKRVPLGDLGCFSFFPGKNLGAYGDAGAIVTDSEEYANKIRKLIDHGRMSKYEHDEFGYNFRMDALQAAIVDVKLKRLPAWTERRREIASLYNKLLTGICETPVPETKEKHVYHLYVIQTDKRNELQSFLKENNIATGIHYPIPLHMQPACKGFNYRIGDFPNTERQAERILSLPIYPELKDEEIEMIVAKVKEFLL